jgi:hypothetical protein
MQDKPHQAPPASGSEPSSEPNADGSTATKHSPPRCSVTVTPPCSPGVKAVKTPTLDRVDFWEDDGGAPGPEEPSWHGGTGPSAADGDGGSKPRRAVAWLAVEAHLRRLVRFRARRVCLVRAQRWACRLQPGVPLRPVAEVRASLLADVDAIDDCVDAVERVLLSQARRGRLPTDRENFLARLATVVRDVATRRLNKMAAPRFLRASPAEASCPAQGPELVAVNNDFLVKALAAIERLEEPHGSVMRRQVRRGRLMLNGVAPADSTEDRKPLQRARAALRAELDVGPPMKRPVRPGGGNGGAPTPAG